MRVICLALVLVFLAVTDGRHIRHKDHKKHNHHHHHHGDSAKKDFIDRLRMQAHKKQFVGPQGGGQDQGCCAQSTSQGSYSQLQNPFSCCQSSASPPPCCQNAPPQMQSQYTPQYIPQYTPQYTPQYIPQYTPQMQPQNTPQMQPQVMSVSQPHSSCCQSTSPPQPNCCQSQSPPPCCLQPQHAVPIQGCCTHAQPAPTTGSQYLRPANPGYSCCQSSNPPPCCFGLHIKPGMSKNITMTNGAGEDYILNLRLLPVGKNKGTTTTKPTSSPTKETAATSGPTSASTKATGSNAFSGATSKPTDVTSGSTAPTEPTNEPTDSSATSGPTLGSSASSTTESAVSIASPKPSKKATDSGTEPTISITESSASTKATSKATAAASVSTKPTSGLTSEGSTTSGESSPTTASSASTAPSNPQPTNSQDRCQEKALAEHNAKRQLHNSPAMVLDDQLNTEAQAYADKLAAEKQVKHSLKTDRVGQGENLALKCSNPDKGFDCKDASLMWYNEVAKYDFNDPKYSSETGHFTQVVWRGSTKLGIGKASYPKDGMTCWVVVGRYRNQGNVEGQFQENVQQGGYTGRRAHVLHHVVKKSSAVRRSHT